MSYCINPKCEGRHNQGDEATCLTCGTPLLIEKQYRLLRPLRDLDEPSNTEVFEVKVGENPKVLKVLQNPNLLPWFQREAQVLKHLNYPGIIPRVEQDGYFPFKLKNGKELYCLVMEKLEGENLEQWLKKNKSLPQAEAVEWLKQLITILNILHENKLFHRDIKLSNILLKSDKKLALLDFGTVREKTKTYQEKCTNYREMTAIVSPGYSPLEQVNGRGVEQSDFYALGRCFVYLLTGVHPLDFPEDEQTRKLIWYDSDRKDNISLVKWIKDSIAPPSSKQDCVHLHTYVRHPGFSEDKQISRSIERNSDLTIDTWLAKLIDYLIEPIVDKRPRDTKEILNRLKLEQQFLQEEIQQQRSRQKNKFFHLCDIVLSITVLITSFFYLKDLYFDESTSRKQKSDSNKQEKIYSGNINAQSTKKC